MHEFLPAAQLYGADIDSEILFESKQIKTCFVDQTLPRTFNNIYNMIGTGNFDLIIIDGLHHPYADLVSMVKLLPRLKINGYLFIEDIRKSGVHRIFWNLAPKLLKSQFYRTTLFDMKGGMLLQVYRIN